VLPELFITGYPPRDLLDWPWFMAKVKDAITTLTERSADFPKTGILIGAPLSTGKEVGLGRHNSALLIDNGKIIRQINKSLLPTYDVFDEARYFDMSSSIEPVDYKGEKLGISICEDAWNDRELWTQRCYTTDPIEVLAGKGATLFINISASPFYVGKDEIRWRIVTNHARKHGIPFVFVNQVGATDELIFDGRSICVDGQGRPIKFFPSFVEDIETIDTVTSGRDIQYKKYNRIDSLEKALVMGTREYITKCGFKKAVIGLSGGIDSAVVAAIAVKALGAENVLGVAMPSPYSSKESADYAEALANNLGFEFKIMPIGDIYQAYIDEMDDHLTTGSDISVTLENIQARIRGNILMAISNDQGHLVLSTGNKSELAVGYCTLYGDMSGGLAVINDVPKTMVYQLAKYMNRENEIIPSGIINRTPSAELRPDQKDSDSLPPYEILDGILLQYIDNKLSLNEIVDLGYERNTVEWVIRAVNGNEYKRRQAAPGLKVTSVAFGMGRRMPIAAKYEV
jgi:NAD+ synthase (glutamine-hydrolysing)